MIKNLLKNIYNFLFSKPNVELNNILPTKQEKEKPIPIELLTYDKTEELSKKLDEYMSTYGVFERENINLIIEYMRNTILVKITFLYHIESHGGYCSGAEAEEISNNKKTIVYELISDAIKYDEDNEIDTDSLKYLKMYAKCVPEAGSGYCNCTSYKLPEHATRATKNDILIYPFKKYNKNINKHDDTDEWISEKSIIGLLHTQIHGAQFLP